MKGFAPLLLIPIIILAILGVAVVAVPGLGSALASIADPARHCSETPFKAECFCDASEEKLTAPALAGIIPRYFCEKKVKFLDPADPLWADKAKAYASTKLSELFPGCDMASCNSHGVEWKAGPGYRFPSDDTPVSRIFGLDCIDSTGILYAQFRFDVETGVVMDPAMCGSWQQVQDMYGQGKEQVPAKLESSHVYDDAMRSGTLIITLALSSDCNNDNGIAVTSVMAPNGNIDHWQIGNYGGSAVNIGSNCQITDSSADYATVKCSVPCPHGGFGGMPLSVEGTYSQSYLNSLRTCSIGDNYFHVSNVTDKFSGVVCGSYRYTCEPDGTWLRREIGYQSSVNNCPTTYKAMCNNGGPYWSYYMPGTVLNGKTCQTNGVWA